MLRNFHGASGQNGSPGIPDRSAEVYGGKQGAQKRKALFKQRQDMADGFVESGKKQGKDDDYHCIAVPGDHPSKQRIYDNPFV